MSMNSTPVANRVHIGFFGRRNAGKSSVVNAVTGQDLSVVSDVRGTTTDPVMKTMELLPLGPVLIMDTPGYDDEGMLGELRVKKTKQILNKTDIAVLVVDIQVGLGIPEQELLTIFRQKKIPYLIAYNKVDLCSGARSCPEDELQNARVQNAENSICVSARTKEHIYELKERIAFLVKDAEIDKHLVADLIKPGDFVVLVTPIDSAAPKGRLILPQQQTIRDILEAGAMSVVIRETELTDTLRKIGCHPSLVITDSQVFEKVAREVPEDIYLTSFSILMARFKGTLAESVKGATALDVLQDGDAVLISEGCTHHRQCDDIGTVKLPRWLKEYTKKELQFSFTSGGEFPEDLSKYRLIIHCGGCMLNEREMKYRMKCAQDAGVSITNYGTAIAQMKGILQRSLAVLQDY